MLPKPLFCKNRKTIFSISWWHISSMLHSEGLLWAPAAAQNHQMSSMRWLKAVKSCYQNNYFGKMGKTILSMIAYRYFQHAAFWRAAVAPAAQNHQMSLMRWLKVVKSCYQNNHFAKMEKQFFRYHDSIFPACCILKGCCGACCCTKLPNELDEVVKSSQIMLPKQSFCENGKTIFSISCWHISNMLHSEGLLWRLLLLKTTKWARWGGLK